MTNITGFPIKAISAEALSASPWSTQRVAFTLSPAAAATDIVSIGSSSFDEMLSVSKISISGICTSGNSPLTVSIITSYDRSDYPTSGTIYPTKAELDSAGFPTGLNIGLTPQTQLR